MEDIILYSNLLMCIVWLAFWLFDIGSFIKSTFFSPNFCCYIFIGFVFRLIGDLVTFDFFVYVGSIIIFYALYKNIFPTKTSKKSTSI